MTHPTLGEWACKLGADWTIFGHVTSPRTLIGYLFLLMQERSRKSRRHIYIKHSRFVSLLHVHIQTNRLYYQETYSWTIWKLSGADKATHIMSDASRHLIPSYVEESNSLHINYKKEDSLLITSYSFSNWLRGCAFESLKPIEAFVQCRSPVRLLKPLCWESRSTGLPRYSILESNPIQVKIKLQSGPTAFEIMRKCTMFKKPEYSIPLMCALL